MTVSKHFTSTRLLYLWYRTQSYGAYVVMTAERLPTYAPRLRNNMLRYLGRISYILSTFLTFRVCLVNRKNMVVGRRTDCRPSLSGARNFLTLLTFGPLTDPSENAELFAVYGCMNVLWIFCENGWKKGDGYLWTRHIIHIKLWSRERDSCRTARRSNDEWYNSSCCSSGSFGFLRVPSGCLADWWSHHDMVICHVVFAQSTWSYVCMILYYYEILSCDKILIMLKTRLCAGFRGTCTTQKRKERYTA